MATRYTDAFRRDAVRIAISSGLTLAPPSHMLCMCCRATEPSIRSIDEREPTDDAARIEVEDYSEIQPALAGPDIEYIARLLPDRVSRSDVLRRHFWFGPSAENS